MALYGIFLRKPEGDTNVISFNIIYLAAAGRVIWLPPEERSYLALGRRVIWRPQEEVSSGRQKSYESQSKLTE